MKNNLLLGLWLLAAATALCSCANEAAEELPENDPTRQTITASIDQQESRVMLGGDKKLNVHWEAGDEILWIGGGVMNHTFRSECSLISGAGSSVATFLKGEEIPLETERISPKATRQLNVKSELIYPVTAFNKTKLHENVAPHPHPHPVVVLYLNLPNEQLYRPNNIARGANIMLARSWYYPTESCTFANLCGAIKFKLPATIPAGDPQVASISINTDRQVWGTAWIYNEAAPKDWKLTMVPPASDDHSPHSSITLSGINKSYSELQKEEIYVVLPPQTYNSLTFSVQPGNGYPIVTVSTQKAFTVERGVIHNLGEMK